MRRGTRSALGLLLLTVLVFFDVLIPPITRILSAPGTDLQTQFVHWRLLRQVRCSCSALSIALSIEPPIPRRVGPLARNRSFWAQPPSASRSWLDIYSKWYHSRAQVNSCHCLVSLIL